MPTRFLKEEFYRSFDPGFVNLCFREILGPKSSPLPQRLSYWSEGHDFICYKISPRVHQLHIPLALKLPHSHQFRKKSPREWKEWAGMITQLSRSEYELIPPMEVLWHEEHLCIVMPFGVSYTSEPNTSSIMAKELHTSMTSLGFDLGDIPQFYQVNGQSFNVDFSSIKSLVR